MSSSCRFQSCSSPALKQSLLSTVHGTKHHIWSIWGEQVKPVCCFLSGQVCRNVSPVLDTNTWLWLTSASTNSSRLYLSTMACVLFNTWVATSSNSSSTENVNTRLKYKPKPHISRFSSRLYLAWTRPNSVALPGKRCTGAASAERFQTKGSGSCRGSRLRCGLYAAAVKSWRKKINSLKTVDRFVRWVDGWKRLK